MARPPMKDQRAFTLLEIIAALGIVAVILVIINLMTRSLKAQSDLSDTRLRMEAIVEKAKAYYVQHGDLPIPRGPGGELLLEAEIPVLPAQSGGNQVNAGVLDIDANYRFDSWQRPMRYITRTNDGQSGRLGEIRIDPLYAYAGGPNPDARPPIGPAMVIDVGTRTLLRAIQYEGRRVAGLIISSGPDGEDGYTLEEGDPVTVALNPGSDDIILPIDLTEEATRSALAELKVLNEKVAAFEDRYLGVNNIGGEDPLEYDEDGCGPIPEILSIPARTVYLRNNCNNWQGRVQVQEPDQPPPSTNEDINCGRPTLDYMKSNFCQPLFGNCPPGYYSPRRGEVRVFANVFDQNGTVIDTIPCGTIEARPAGPATVPFFNPAAPLANYCYWGLVATQYEALLANETDADQARAFIRCLFGLRPDDVVDPWLNGYVWGCDSDSDCYFTYPFGDPHHHRFFSAGPDGLPARLEALVETTPEAQAATDDIVD